MEQQPDILLWILGSGLLMSAIALIGGVTTILGRETLQRIIPSLIALAAGSLLGGAFLHLIPEGMRETELSSTAYFSWVLIGFTLFFSLEQWMHWHRCRRPQEDDCNGTKPVTWLILVGDALHNFIGGLAVAGAFLVDVRLGITMWIAAALHEVPQELGDFGVLVHGGWERGKALLANLLSALTFPLGGIIAWLAAGTLDITFLLPFAAGNFIYIGASDLVPELSHHERVPRMLLHFSAFVVGWVLMLAVGLLS